MPDLKPELSQKNKYWIPKHRYYELKHYCLQYPDWKKLYSELNFNLVAHADQEIRGTDISRVNEEIATKRADLFRAMQLIEHCVRTCTDVEILQHYIFKAVTEGIPYVQLQTKFEIPCGPDMYYDTYRRFFWQLSQGKGI